MTTFTRDLRKNAKYHVFNRGIDHMDIFLEPEDYRFYLQRLKICQEEYGFELYAVCLMTNHYHIIIKDVGLNLPLIMDSINSVYVRYFNEKYNRKGPLFGEPFKHSIIFTEAALTKLVRYVNRNPVAAGMTTNVFDYPWVLVIPEKDYFRLINFSYLNEVFQNICNTPYEEYLKSDIDDCWVDEIEVHKMDDKTAERVFCQIIKRIGSKEDFDKNDISDNVLKEILTWASYRKLTIRQMSMFTGISKHKIIKIRDGD